MMLTKIADSFGFSQILCSSITWNKHKESLFVNSEEIIWTRPFKRKFVSTPCRPMKKGVSNFCSHCVYVMPITKQLMCNFKKITVFLDVNLSLPENCTFSPHIYKA